MTSILGISAFFHDSAACIVVNGNIIAAAQEERFSRIKHDSGFPIKSINFVLNHAKIKIKDIDYIVFYENPNLKFNRILKSYIGMAPKGFFSFKKSMSLWLKGKLFQKNLIYKNLKKIDESFNEINKIKFNEHHYSHAASAFFPSPFQEALVLTADGTGEWATTTIAVGKKNKLEIKKEIKFPHSLGLLYSAFTYYCGFKVNSGEYKLMGLAAYGKPIYEDMIYKKIIDVKGDGSFRLNQKYFDYITGNKMINSTFEKLFQHKRRDPNKDKILQFHMDIAASIQKVTENILIKICTSIQKEYKLTNLCLAGGVALNCVANGKIINEKIFDKIWVQPAAGDAGGALGAAIGYWYDTLNNNRETNTTDKMQGSYLGPEYNQHFIESELKKSGAIFEKFDDNIIIEKTAEDLSKSLAVGWFQGRMEFGPRALGNRSILADPRDKNMQKNLNLKIKFRESFRPFAPSILRDDLTNWFKINCDSPYMLIVSEIKNEKKLELSTEEKKLFGIEKLNIKNSEVPAITHVDYTARVQTVDKNINSKFYNLLKKFKDKTDCPILVNTSFNVRGEPIVSSPREAFECFMGTELDRLIIGNCYLTKANQNKKLIKSYHNKYELD